MRGLHFGVYAIHRHRHISRRCLQVQLRRGALCRAWSTPEQGEVIMDVSFPDDIGLYERHAKLLTWADVRAYCCAVQH